MDKFNLITIFIAIADTSGFAAAARKLNISPPAVTRAINELETQLNVRLLTRTTRKVRVTDAGARYVEDCRKIIAELSEADESVGGSHGAPRGRLTLTAPVLFGSKFVTPIVAEYLQTYPEVSASCLFLDRIVNMMDEGIDVAIRIGELPDSSMQSIRVGQVRRVICAAPGYLKQYGIPRKPEDLQNHSIISANSMDSSPEWTLMEGGVARVIKLQSRFTTSSNDSAIAATAGGFGLTRLLSYQIADFLRAGQLKTLLGQCEPPALPIHVVHREGRHASKKARAFIDLAVARLRANKALN